MDEPCSSKALPPFFTKTYEMVDDPSTNAIVFHGVTVIEAFIVCNPPEFARDLLPKYFKHSNFSSCIGQLNMCELFYTLLNVNLCYFLAGRVILNSGNLQMMISLERLATSFEELS